MSDQTSPPPTAALLAIGDELTIGQHIDTNSQWLAEQLIACGVMAIEHRTVADDRAAIATALRELIGRASIIITSGGLGPTADDLTRHAIGDVLTPEQPLVTDTDAAAQLERWFKRHSRALSAINLIQAQRPATMRCLPNPHGTAPGLAGEHHGTWIFALPGPPREMMPMFTDHIISLLPASPGRVIRTEIVQEYGMGESDAALRLGEMTDRPRNPLIGTTASASIVSARIRATGTPDEVDQLISQDLNEIQSRWSPYVFSCGDQSLAESTVALLRDHRATLTTAESCTGGWLGMRIVDVPGSSDVYLGGWITYSNAMKTALLGVDPCVLAAHGAVSVEVARDMAAGAIELVGSCFALAVTGIAGPAGGTEAKPVGTVLIALAHRTEGAIVIHTRRFHFNGDRTTVRDRSVKSAMQMLRFALLNVQPQTPLLWQVADEGTAVRNT